MALWREAKQLVNPGRGADNRSPGRNAGLPTSTSLARRLLHAHGTDLPTRHTAVPPGCSLNRRMRNRRYGGLGGRAGASSPLYPIIVEVKIARRTRVALERQGPRTSSFALAAMRAPHETLILAHAGRDGILVRFRCSCDLKNPRTASPCGKLPSGRIRFGRVWRKLQLARPDLVSGELPVDRIDAEISPLLWR
jgi:hypothetical protein